LHYVFDLWIHHWRRRYAKGDVIFIRYADDTVLGFQYKQDADALLEAFKSRLSGFGLALHPDKTRLLEFGRYAQERRAKAGKVNRRRLISWVLPLLQPRKEERLVQS